jgi:hypothetical protein
MQIVALGAGLGLLSGCGTAWNNANKSPQEAKADARVCAAEAEETALARASRQRVDYGATSPTQPGMRRGETPMQLVDRTRTEDTYQRDFGSCMRSKGYTQDPTS